MTGWAPQCDRPHGRLPLRGASRTDRGCRGSQGKVALMFDEDKAGWKGREEALSRLGHRVFVKVIGLGEEGRQPDSVPEADLKKYILGL